MSSFLVDLNTIDYHTPEDEELNKSDVVISIIPDLKINFQIKEITFHPQDKKQCHFNDEIGWVKAWKKGKTPRRHSYNWPYSTWQTAVQATLDDMEDDSAYTVSEKRNMDLLFFLKDGALSSDQSYSFDELGRVIN